MTSSRILRTRLAFAFALAAAALSCGDGPTSPEPAEPAVFDFVVDGRALGTAGVILLVEGEGLRELVSPSSAQLLTSGETSQRVLVVGSAELGTSVLAIRVADGKKYPRARVIEAAAGEGLGFVQLDTARYRVRPVRR